MIIDFHTHTFPNKIAEKAVQKLSDACHTVPFTNGTAAELTASMKDAGIAMSVVLPVATNPEKVSAINDVSAELNGKDGLLHFGCMHPTCPDWHSELGRIAALGLKGIKLHPIYQDVDFDDIRYLRILDRAAELGLIVVTHSGEDIGFPGVVRYSPQMVANALKQVGDVTLVLAHMGGWRNWQEAEALLSGSCVYIDTSFSLGTLTPTSPDYYTERQLRLLDESEFVRIVRSFGSEKVLFGTDSPWTMQKSSAEAFTALPLTEKEKQEILYGNAARLLKLSRQ